MGYDANSGEYVDMYKAGIIDPVKVVRTALSNAASIAALLLTTEALVTNFDKDDKNQAARRRRGAVGTRSRDQTCPGACGQCRCSAPGPVWSRLNARPTPRPLRTAEVACFMNCR